MFRMHSSQQFLYSRGEQCALFELKESQWMLVAGMLFPESLFPLSDMSGWKVGGACYHRQRVSACECQPRLSLRSERRPPQHSSRSSWEKCKHIATFPPRLYQNMFSEVYPSAFNGYLPFWQVRFVCRRCQQH